MTDTFTGSGRLARQALRRDRVIAGVWVLVLVATCYASAAATDTLYRTGAEQQSAAEAINNSPAVVALYGPILDVHSLGELAMTKMTVLYAVFVAILFVVLVRRHTRVEEEAGRAELIGGTVTGRNAALAAAVLEAALIAIVLGLLAGIGNIVAGLPVTGSLLFAASWAGVGLVAAGLAAVACQVSASARTCGAIAAAGLGVLYVVRAVGDTSVGWLSWLSPFGWSTQLRAWSDPRWWVLALYVVLFLALVGLAQGLRARRDLGAGILADRPGPAVGSPRLADAFALSVRVHRAALVTWSVAVGALGVVMGAIAPSIGNLLDSKSAREMIERIGGVGKLQETLVAAELSIAAIVISCFAITVVTHSGGDEHDGRTEQVLATAASRAGTFLGTAVVALVGVSWLLLVTGVMTALGFGSDFTRIGSAALAQAPAVWVVTTLALAFFAWRSAWSIAGWVVLAVFLVLGLIGELLRLPSWVIGLSPYTHVPQMPVAGFAPLPEAVLALIAAVLVAVAWLGYRDRDIG